MALFLSTFTNKIDKKKRVSVPASFRALMKENAFVAFRSLTQPAIEGFSMQQMQGFSKKIDHFQLFSEDQSDLTASIFADAEALAFDKEGRIPLSDELIAHAELKSHVCFVGRGATFQLWNPETFKDYQQKARQRLMVRRPKLVDGKGQEENTEKVNREEAQKTSAARMWDSKD